MKKVRINIVFYVLLVFSLGLSVFSLLTFKVDDVRIDNENVVDFNKGWTNITDGRDQDILTLPNRLEATSNQKVIIQNTISDEWKGLALAFHSTDQLLKVYIDETEVYSYGYENERAFGHTPGSAWHFVTIPHELEKANVRIEITAAYQQNHINLPSFLVGTKNACVFTLFKSNIIEFVISVFVLLIGVFLIVVYFIVKKVMVKRVNFIYLGLFTIIMSLSSMIETRLLQIVVGNQDFFSNSIFQLHMLAPVAIALYVGETYFFQWRSKYQLIAKVFMLNYILCVILHIANLMDFMETKELTHIFILMTCAYMIYSMVRLFQTKKKYGDLIYFSVALLFLMGSVILDLIRYYLFNVTDVAKSYRVGLLVYILILVGLDLKRTISFVRQGLNSKSLKKVAYEDGLTKCRNRIYFEEKFSEIRGKITEYSEVVIAVFDINDLKKINDNKGHSEGDSMLIDASKLIKEYFSEYAHVSRIGGDEFAIVMQDVNETEIKERFKKFHRAMEENNRSIEAVYSIAYGYAQYTPEVDNDLHETFNRADSYMYRCKEEMKKKHLSNCIN